MNHPTSYQTIGHFYGQVVYYEDDMFEKISEAQDIEAVEIYSHKFGTSFGGDMGPIRMKKKWNILNNDFRSKLEC